AVCARGPFRRIRRHDGDVAHSNRALCLWRRAVDDIVRRRLARADRGSAARAPRRDAHMIATFTAFAILFAILFFGLPLAFALGLVGLVGFAILMGANAAAAMSAQIAWDTLTSYSLSVLPLFILMGNLVNHSGLSRNLYDASNAFIGHRRGGLAMATIL